MGVNRFVTQKSVDRSIRDKVDSDGVRGAKLFCARSAHLRRESKLLYHRLDPRVRNFLASCKDYFDIFASSGKVKTEFGELNYLAQLRLGELPCVLLDNSQGGQDLALASILSGDWKGWRLITFTQDKKIARLSAHFDPWLDFEIPSLRRNFHVMSYLHYHKLKLDKFEKLDKKDIETLDLVNFILNFTEKGNAVSRGLNELEEISSKLACQENLFTDLEAATILGLYLVQCSNFLGDFYIKFNKEHLPVMCCQFKGFNLCFECGRFARYILKVSYRKATMAGAIRQLISLLQNPRDCVAQEYSPYIYWQDELFNYIDSQWSNLTLPHPPLEAAKQWAHKLFLQSCVFQDKESTETIVRSYWWCECCHDFDVAKEVINRDVLSLDELYLELYKSIWQQSDHFCKRCHNSIDKYSLFYATLCLHWEWPQKDVCLEVARLEDKRLVRGWGIIDRECIAKEQANINRYLERSREEEKEHKRESEEARILNPISLNLDLSHNINEVNLDKKREQNILQLSDLFTE